MTLYRLYFLDRDGRIRSAENVECPSDAAALTVAVKRESPDLLVEVWDGARAVGRMDRTPRKSHSPHSSRFRTLPSARDPTRHRSASIYSATVRGALRRAFPHTATFSVHTDITGLERPRVAVRWSGEPSVERVRAVLAPLGLNPRLEQDHS